MEPDVLDPILAPLETLAGVGPAVGTLLAKVAGGGRVLDLLFHLPEGWIDRRERTTIRAGLPGQVVTFAAEVVRHEPPGNERQPWKTAVTDGSAFAELVFFDARRRWIGRRFPAGTKVLISGKLDAEAGRPVLQNPPFVVAADRPGDLPGVEPVWPLTAGLWMRQVAGAMARALAVLPELPEWHDAALLRRERWPGFAEALRALQAPEAPPGPEARARLAYDELLAGQVALGLVRLRSRARPGRALAGDGALRAAALARFGFVPTASQAKALEEIDRDLAAPRRMLRLLQGDVGSGKTLVALMAMLRAVEAGAQAVMMAPTELLARQHHRTLLALSPVPVALLAGSVRGAERARVLAGLENGSIPLAVGTHALVQRGVAFRDLALAVIDEQHRFGVDQRVTLGAKGAMTDVLVMTATPIPRTVLLTQWGEMEVSRITGKPAGRRPVKTTLHSLANLGDVADATARALEGGAQVYWVCPLVTENEDLDLAAAEERFASLRHRFGALVGLAHGRQESAAREAALADFAAGRTRLLVATTVIEVGVDVPAASVMVVEHAERFGLAQLHQLRGRVGRGSAASFCLLLHDDRLTEGARRRLLLLRDTDDGFVIADEDFRLRGGGDLLGTRQSGEPGFRLAHPVEHEGLLNVARKDADVLLHRDPRLISERGMAVRVLLRMFDKKRAIGTLRSG